jgi:hypothetical protein
LERILLMWAFTVATLITRARQSVGCCFPAQPD